LLLAIGAADFLTGSEVSLVTFYLLPVSLAAWFLGRSFAAGAAILSVTAIWLAGDFTAGVVGAKQFVLGWNAGITLAFFMIVLCLLHSLQALLRDLEARVQQRTAALTLQSRERERLERELLEISEREQRRIGHDLHDGLGQHLTGTALAAKVLCDQLATRCLPEAADAERLVGLIEDAIELTRSLARGLSPVPLEADGLMMACLELAEQTSERFHLDCRFSCASPVVLDDPVAAAHLYRIAQEATSNAVRHGHSQRIEIALAQQSEGSLTLSIEDDGVGLDPVAKQGRQPGLGLRIMAHRARMIGGLFDVRSEPRQGTSVQCFLASPAH
jgi:signal transduction histidine kinase